ncbi:ThiF family adenylyltransferase [Methylobacterium sp. A54F]
MAWLDDWGPAIDAGEMRLPVAMAVARYVTLHAAGIATVVGAHRNEDGSEILVLDFRTGVPQRPAVELDRIEPVGIAFDDRGSSPFVLMLREDFPDTEHQQLVPEGCPAAMCIDDRPWEEARLTWTPAELIERVLIWFHRAARGELHDPAQPLDPFFGYSPWQFVFPASVLSGRDGVELVGAINDAVDPNVVIVLPLAALAKDTGTGRILPIAYEVPPERMRRLRKAPRDLAALSAMLKERGVNLYSDLRDRIVGWTGVSEQDRPRMNASLAIIVAMPVIGPTGTRPGMVDVRAFMTTRTVGEIGVALGVLLAAQSTHSPSGFARQVITTEPDDTALAACGVEIAQVHVAFDPDRAATLSGRSARDGRKAVMVGAGAVGSHLAEYMTREGRFDWTIVDDDRLIPHNLARHTLRSPQVGLRKAHALKDRLNAIFTLTGPTVVGAAIGCDILKPGEHSDELALALSQAEIIIDATASVAASRHLADLSVGGRRVCVFFNPSAEAAVVLVEAADRAVALRDLEAQYYRAVLQHAELERHLTAVGERFAYTGACRAVTNRVPASRVALLSALAAQALGEAVDRPDAFIGIWSIGAEGQVTPTRPALSQVERVTILDWEVALDASVRASMVAMREARLPSETGGAVIGVVDTRARRIHLVEALPPPPDSVGSPTQFERGVAGLGDDIAAKEARVMHQVRYVGEWHSHPRLSSIQPSETDLVQLGSIIMDLSIDGLPSLSVIVGDVGITVALGELDGDPAT